MTLEAEIARQIYEELRDNARESRSVRLPVRIAELQRLWPQASHDQLLRAHLIAYELLILDVAEGVSAASESAPQIPPSPRNKDTGGEGGKS